MVGAELRAKCPAIMKQLPEKLGIRWCGLADTVPKPIVLLAKRRDKLKIAVTSAMNCSDNTEPPAPTAFNRDDAGVVLVREAGVPFQPPLGDASGIDPFAEWLSLMEVVQMLCPVWPVRDTPMQGTQWRL